MKPKKLIFSFVIIAILILSSGWLVFSAKIRPNHYQLLRPYTLSGGKRLAGTETRIGEDGALQILIPGGTAVLGKNEWQTEMNVPAYWIRQIPVTLKEYNSFVWEAGRLLPHYREEPEETQGWWNGLKPVVYVSWDEAEDYCSYYGGHLPTEAQWEKAARGTDGTVLYWEEDRAGYSYANYGGFYNGKIPAGWLPKGKSPYGVLDMAGNVREWVLDPLFSEDQPVMTETAEEILAMGNVDAARILKGGGFSDDLAHVRLNWRDAHDPKSPGAIRGFRCVYEYHDTEK